MIININDITLNVFSDPALPIPGRVPFATSTTLAIPETTDAVNQREPTYVNVGARSHILPTASPLQSSKAKTRQVENKPIKILEPSQQHTIRILNGEQISTDDICM